MSLIESTLHPEAAVFRHVIPAGEPYLFEVKAGQTLRLLDLEGNQAVDTLFFSARNPRERYDPQRTLRKQNSVYLTTGTVLWSNLGNPLLTISADTCGRHDTLGGACAQESNTVRYALDKRYMHSCRDNYLLAIQHADIGLRGAARKCPRIDLCCAVDEARHHLKGREKHRLNERRLPSRQFVQLREDRCGAFMAEEDEGVRASALLLKCLHDADVRLGFVLEHAPIDPGERARVEKVPNKLANRCIQTRVAEHQQ
mgnify:CR=1 FL=1